jgi:hypothetical protein
MATAEAEQPCVTGAAVRPVAYSRALTATELSCVECKRRSSADDYRRWRAYRRDTETEDELVVYCPACVDRLVDRPTPHAQGLYWPWDRP